jgi:hypothetical protein
VDNHRTRDDCIIVTQVATLVAVRRSMGFLVELMGNPTFQP